MSARYLYYYDAYPAALSQYFYGVKYSVEITNLAEEDTLILKGSRPLPKWMYGQEARPTNILQQHRQWESLWHKFEDRLKIGIGSAGHFLGLKNGAEIYKSISGHQSPHLVYFPIMKRTFKVESAHSQALDLSRVPAENYELWGYTSVSRNSINQASRIILDSILEPEVVWFPKTKSLCIEFDLQQMATMPLPKNQNLIISLIVQYALRLINESIKAQ